VNRREGKPLRFARAIRATDIHPSDASASTVFARAVRWRNTTGETVHYRGDSIYASFPGYSILSLHLSNYGSDLAMPGEGSAEATVTGGLTARGVLRVAVFILTIDLDQLTLVTL
jgi:hypothetical protein